MIPFLVFITVLGVAVVAVALWKFGFVHEAQTPLPLIDRPLMDGKERRAFLKRLKRWRDEGKCTREEYEHIRQLCESEWNEPD